MGIHHVVSTTLNSGEVVTQPGRSLMLVCRMEANAAGNPKLCKEQTIETREGTQSSYSVMSRVKRVSSDGRWSDWIEACTCPTQES
jgi:hypothetical protein